MSHVKSRRAFFNPARAIELYKTRIEIYKTTMELYKTTTEIYKTTIDIYKTTVEIYKSTIAQVSSQSTIVVSCIQSLPYGRKPLR